MLRGFQERSRSVYGLILGMVMLFGVAGLSVAEAQTGLDNLQQFLREDADFSRKEFAQMKSGEGVTKLLKLKSKHEVVVLSITRVDVPRAFFLQHYGKDVAFVETRAVASMGRFSDPPTLSDVQGLKLDPRDIKALEECAAGDCNMKISTTIMERFKKEVDWSAPDHEDRANALARQMVFEYLQAYLRGGNAAMTEYHDQKSPIQTVEEFRDLLKHSPYLFRYKPKFYTYLEQYPDAELPGVQNFIYWAKEDIGANYQIVSLNHITSLVPEDPAESPIMAAKQIYANHYFEAALGLTVAVENSETATPSFYLVYLNRSRLDALRRGGFTGKLIRRKLEGNMVALMDQRLTVVKNQVETLYRNR